jgi:hypothetical protein
VDHAGWEPEEVLALSGRKYTPASYYMTPDEDTYAELKQRVRAVW